MDIEGAELNCIKGGTETFKNCPDLVLELNNFTSTNFYGFHITKLTNKLKEIGYNKAFIYLDQINQVTFEQLDEMLLQPDFVMIDVLLTK